MKLSKAIKIVESGNVIYEKHIKDIERKIRILKRRSIEKSKGGSAGSGQRLFDKAEQWKEVLSKSFWNIRNKVERWF
jgi:hypothetical protein